MSINSRNHRPIAVAEELCLLAPGQLSSQLRYFAEMAAPGAAVDPADLAQHWRDAREIYRQLAITEAGAADNPQIKPWPKSLAAYQEQVQALPAIRNTFNTVPVAFGLVELDRLVVSQFSMTQATVQGLQASFKRPPTPRQLAALCLPLTASPATFRLAYRDNREFVFVSSAHDMRFLDAVPLAAADMARLAVEGHPQAAVALAVGFSANVVNVVRFGNRLVLNNGHHRAHALQAMGITHMPCLIQVCGSQAELREAASADICDNTELCFESSRPPLLRDFKHPGLTRRLRTLPQQRELRVSIKVESRLLSL